MRLEILMKKRLISSLLNYYGEDIIKVFKNFFNNKNRLIRYNYSKGNSILAILKNPQIAKESKKFEKIINILYLSDILFLFLCCEQFRKSEILERFYHNIPEKFGVLNRSREDLLNLRNTVAHYNFKDFELNKKRYKDAINLFEYHLGHDIAGIKELPKFDTKPSIKSILIEIEKLRPDLFKIDTKKDDEIEYFYNKHRLLLDLCDEIAIYNGYETKELPSPWTIIRQMYAINKDKRKFNFSFLQLKLFNK